MCSFPGPVGRTRVPVWKACDTRGRQAPPGLHAMEELAKLEAEQGSAGYLNDSAGGNENGLQVMRCVLF